MVTEVFNWVQNVSVMDMGVLDVTSEDPCTFQIIFDLQVEDLITSVENAQQ